MTKEQIEIIHRIYDIFVEIMDFIVKSSNEDSPFGYMLIITYPSGKATKDGVPIESLVSCRGDAVVTSGTALGVIKEFVRNSKNKKELTRLIAEASEEILDGYKKELNRG